ncbi:protein bangles and beads-like [Anopheles marshallii]|uniref:protein bangles and beads-like n=1 Tax=Anopheles marshallii TaxID=1521116 RepID=UPI00237B95A4|nr:protein bangles and beads-like [Anopheles marshallii]
MKLCLLIAAAVAIATCYALPVPKEEVFAVYPVNSALAQHSSDLPVETKPEQVNSPAEGSLSKDAVDEKTVTATKSTDVTPVESKPEELKTVPEKLHEQASAETEAEKKVIPAAEVKSAPLKEPTDVKPEDTPVTVPSTDNLPTTVPIKDVARLEVSESVVAAEPKVEAPKTLAVEPKLMDKEAAPVEKSVKEETKVEDKAKDSTEKLVPNVKTEEKKEESVEVKTPEQTVAVVPEVKAVAVEKSEKLSEEPKAEAKPEPSQARSTTSDLPAEQDSPDAKPEVKVAEQVVVAVAVEPAEVKKPAVEETKASSASVPEVKSVTAAGVQQTTVAVNDPEPQTEGKDETKPTKVRAAPIVEGLTVSQPVEAEPAVTKIHVTVIQEEVELDSKSAAQKEAVRNDQEATPTTEVADKSTEAAVTTTSATPEKEVKRDESVVEKTSKDKDEETSSPSAVKSVEAVVETKPETVKPIDVSKEESSVRAATTETVVVVVPSVNAEDVTTVVALSENTDKPVEKVAEAVPTAVVAPALEVRSADSTEEPPAPANRVKEEEQQAKAADGSSQPGASERSEDTVQEDAKDQSDSISTTVSSVTELDTTTVNPVTTTEPELVPTPAKQKAKKQVPPNLKGYSKRLKLQEAQRKQGNDNE